MQDDRESVIGRIEKDIRMFDDAVKTVKTEERELVRVVEMSKLYAKDSRSYLDKGDLFTSFSCISYAHGLLDAVRSITGLILKE
ncbi:MAG: DUF357 domain-containing protein [Candidatus Micrarchaeota archaeon]|nr:DUF357 domain-containing protein [Candidatus Micrarchaeota archaeon]